MAGRPLVVYDDSCTFCTRSVRLLRRLDWLRRLDDEGYSTASERFPEIGRGALGEGLRVRFADGTVALGADAVRVRRDPDAARRAGRVAALRPRRCTGSARGPTARSPRGAAGSAAACALPARPGRDGRRYRPMPYAPRDVGGAGGRAAATRTCATRRSRLLRDLIRIDTSNPPGRETPAAMLLTSYLEANGVACELVARDPDRANLIARIPGTGEGPSLALLGHTDVVPADARGLDAPAVLRPPGRRRLPVGPRRGRT